MPDSPRLSRRRSASLAALVAIGLSLLGGCGSKNPETLWEDARASFEAKDWDKAEADLARLATLRPATVEDRMLGAQLLMARNKYADAIARLDGVPDSHPMGPLARLQTGQLALRLGRAREAEVALKKAVELNPKEIKARRELIYLYGMQSRWKPLDREFRGLAEMAPLGRDDVILWCLSRNMAWDPDEIQTDLTKFVRADPDDRDSRLALVDNLRRRQFLDEADAALKALPESDPDARAQRVKMALDRGDISLAEALLQEGPLDHVELARLRGKLALFHQDGPAALTHFRAAYQADPENRDSLFGLGTALALVGDKAAAEPYLKRARDYDAIGSIVEKFATTRHSDDPNFYRIMGQAYEKVGRLPEARAWYNLAIALNPLDAEAQGALFRLKPKAG